MLSRILALFNAGFSDTLISLVSKSMSVELSVISYMNDFSCIKIDLNKTIEAAIELAVCWAKYNHNKNETWNIFNIHSIQYLLVILFNLSKRASR